MNLITGGQLAEFRNEYDYVLTSNVCDILNKYICSDKNYLSVTQYGMNVITQRIEEYFRLRNKTAIVQNNIENGLIHYCEDLFKKLIKDFLTGCDKYFIDLKVL